MPGVGKSTIAHATANVLREQGVPVFEPTRTLDHETARGARQATKIAHVLSTLIRAPQRASAFARVTMRAGQNRAAECLSVLANGWYLLEIYRRADRTPGIHVLDQGLFQSLWSVHYAAGNMICTVSDAQAILPRLRARHVVVNIDASTPVVLDRLMHRSNGASRLDSTIRRDGPDGALERARHVADAVDAVVETLARSGTFVYERVENGHGDGTGHAGARMLALRLTALASRNEEAR